MVNESDRRPKPEEFLAQAEREERLQRRGRLKVIIGYAPGVGKSFQMFDEGRRRKARGEDVVVCALQPHYSSDVAAVLQRLEVIPTRKIGDTEAIDVAAIIQRHPQVALIDGLAYDNPPGSSNAHRWQDVEQLLEAGISVITTVNLQYLEKHLDAVERITGKRAPVTIPRGFLDTKADEIVVVDAPATESLSHGAASPGGVADGVADGAADRVGDRTALAAQAHRLSRLRELALLVAAGVVDRQLEGYLQSHGMDQTLGVQERILVCVTPRSNAAQMLQSGRRSADLFHGELYVAYVRQPALSQKDRAVLRENLASARELGAQVEVLSGLDAAETIVQFARRKGITQIFIGQSRREGAWRRLWSNLIDRLIRSAEGIDVSVYPQ